MIIKPSISFLSADNDAQLITDTQAIVAGITGNPTIYATPNPSMPTVSAGLTTFTDAVQAAADGGVTLTAAKNAARANLVKLLRDLANYVATACNNNMENLLLSGFVAQKSSRVPIGVLPAPTNVTVNLGPRSGELIGKTSPLTGAAIYNWRITATGQANPLQTAQTTAASTTFTGLTPGVVYQVEVNAVGSAGPSDWSQIVSQMAL